MLTSRWMRFPYASQWRYKKKSCKSPCRLHTSPGLARPGQSEGLHSVSVSLISAGPCDVPDRIAIISCRMYLFTRSATLAFLSACRRTDSSSLPSRQSFFNFPKDTSSPSHELREHSTSTRNCVLVILKVYERITAYCGKSVVRRVREFFV